ncbi:hypothetical protein KKA50_02710 [Patescibacteria group bacterium]|nr:hypothetical protein [Patescibacteria group bacterium]
MDTNNSEKTEVTVNQDVGLSPEDHGILNHPVCAITQEEFVQGTIEKK